MDIRGILNEPGEGERKRPRPPAESQPRHPPLPSLKTGTQTSSTVGYFTQDSPGRRQSTHPPPSHSPGVQQHYVSGDRPPSNFQPIGSPYAQYSYGPTGTPVSPYVPNSASTSHAQGYFSQPHRSLTRTPSSSSRQDHHHHQYYASPVQSRSETYNPLVATPHHTSQPGTPFGHPANATRPPSYNITEPLHRHNSSHSPSVQPQTPVAAPPPQPWPQSTSTRLSNSPVSLSGLQHRQMSNVVSQAAQNRERSLSVSPKTIVSDLPRQSPHQNSTDRQPQYRSYHAHEISARDPSTFEAADRHSRSYLFQDMSKEDLGKPGRESDPVHPTRALESGSYGEDGQYGALKANFKTPDNRSGAPNAVETNTFIKEEVAQDAGPSETKQAVERDSALSAPPATATLKRPLDTIVDHTTESPQPQPRTKRRRVESIPIWAQPAKSTRPLPKYKKKDIANFQAPNTSTDEGPKSQSDFTREGPLGTLEPSFLGDVVPQEDLTKRICDFLFNNVVINDAVGTGTVGDTASVEGQLEIEAKVGRLIDRRTNERLALPIETEAILRDSYDVTFESTMTQEQHKTINELLNNALKQSMGLPTVSQPANPAASRVKMSYEHRYETDTFYELPADEISNLPQQLRTILKLHPHRKPRLRVTRDQKTGNVLATVVKSRIKDLHVVSPTSEFDWRISVSVEANWTGDLEALAKAAGEATQRNTIPDRHKDRMSYTHLFSQIDLTQVKSNTGTDKNSMTHELEVELDTSALRQQGKLVLNQKPNQYPDLVRTFVNNVRVLVRSISVPAP